MQPKAIYTHCAGRSLSLARLNSCSLSPIKSLTLWIKNSCKREGLLQAVVETYGDDIQGYTNRKHFIMYL